MVAEREATGFRSVYFANVETGWASGFIGDKGEILATTDGGQTWQSQYTANRPIGNLQFVSPLVGWALVEPAPGATEITLLHTTDGGNTWLSLADLNGFGRFDFITPSLGRAISATGLVETTDAGKTWSAVPTSIKLGLSICFSDANNGWSISGGGVVHTTDGGRTWANALPPPTHPDLVNGPYGLWCAGPDVAWSAFLGPVDPVHRYALYRTVDNGAHWAPVLSSGYPQLHATENGGPASFVQIIDSETALVLCFCRAAEFLQTTRDGGQTWSQAVPIPGLNVKSMDFVDADHGWAVGETLHQAVILATTNGGPGRNSTPRRPRVESLLPCRPWR